MRKLKVRTILKCMLIISAILLVITWVSFSQPQSIEDNIYEVQIREDLRIQWIGFADNGTGVKVFGNEAKQAEEELKLFQVNKVLSGHIPYNHTLPDIRNTLCKSIQYDVDSLPSASLIIVFYKEVYSVFIRSLHSIVNTASKNLKEIILVDDGNDDEILKGKLEYYITTRLPKFIKIIRLPRRVGLIKARLAGIEEASGEILVFMDAHTECVVNWLEPLSEHIQKFPNSLAIPALEHFYARDFQFVTQRDKLKVGGFSWGGFYQWFDLFEREEERRRQECGNKAAICPAYSPTIIGGYFAINKKFFFELGTYDNQMEGWGGENIELSFRTWMCGGTIDIIPCSRVAHLARNKRPYKEDKDTFGINTVRFVEVWMDEHKESFYSHRPDLRRISYSIDIRERQELRKRLQCKSFDWYMKNVYPEKFIPLENNRAWGRIENKATGLCIDNLVQLEEKGRNIAAFGCHSFTARSQLHFLTNDGVLRYENSCLSANQTGVHGRQSITFWECEDNDIKWEWTNSKQLRHIKTEKCIEVMKTKSIGLLYVTTCDERKPTQKWIFDHNLS